MRGIFPNECIRSGMPWYILRYFPLFNEKLQENSYSTGRECFILKEYTKVYEQELYEAFQLHYLLLRTTEDNN